MCWLPPWFLIHSQSVCNSASCHDKMELFMSYSSRPPNRARIESSCKTVIFLSCSFPIFLFNVYRWSCPQGTPGYIPPTNITCTTFHKESLKQKQTFFLWTGRLSYCPNDSISTTLYTQKNDKVSCCLLLQAKDTMAWDVPERCVGAASIAITPYSDTGP